MERVELLPLEEVPGIDGLAEMYKKIYGFVPNGVRAMAHRPEIVHGFIALRKAVMSGGKGTVTPELKNLIANIASKASGCRYCQAHSIFACELSGAESERLDQIWDFQNSSLFSSAERAALDFALAAAGVPNKVTDNHYIELKKYWDDGEIIEILAVVSLFGFLNRWNDSLQTPLEERAAESAMTHLSEQGWDIGKHGK